MSSIGKTIEEISTCLILVRSPIRYKRNLDTVVAKVGKLIYVESKVHDKLMQLHWVDSYLS